MVRYRLISSLAVVLSCPLTGCTVYATRPVDIVVARADTGEPAAGLPVEVTYASMLCANIPPKVAGATDADGRVTLPMADFPGLIYLSADGFQFRVDESGVRNGVLLDDKMRALNDVPAAYTVRLVPRRRWLLQHLLGPRGDEYGGLSPREPAKAR